MTSNKIKFEFMPPIKPNHTPLGTNSISVANSNGNNGHLK